MATVSFGPRIRALRRKQGLTQKQLAERLEISASYLNLIENDKRPLSAPLLIKIAGLFGLDFQAFSEDDQARLLADAMEVLGDPLFDEHELTQQDVRDFARFNPGVTQALLTLYRSYIKGREANETLASRIEDAGVEGLSQLQSPEEEVTDFLERQKNYFPALEQAAEALSKKAELEPSDRYFRMARFLEKEHGITIDMVPVESDTAVLRSYNPDRKVLRLAQLLPPRSLHFQLAVQIGLLTYDEEIQRIVGEASFSSPAALTLARLAMANYFAGAVLMPYEPFVKAARAHRFDVELLGHRFRTSYEQVCHRLTTLRRPGSEGVPFHMVRVDMAGNISKRFSGSGIRFARYGGACPKWNVHAAFLTPGVIRTQVSQMPDGRVYFCFARSIQQDIGGYSQAKHVHAVGLGCKVEHGRDIVYADGIDLEGSRAVIEVGVTCRLCDRADCRQRAFPTLQHRLEIDENKRGINFYSPVDD